MFGQMSIKKISKKADYLQLAICGLNCIEAVEYYKKYNTDIPIILHGDWEKSKGLSANSILDNSRINEYINIINELKKITKVYGITLHPTNKRKCSLAEFIQIKNYIEKESGIDVFVENRSGTQFHLSAPEDIIKFSQENKMTIDIPQLFISCQYNTSLLNEVISKLNHKNIIELHIGNIVKDGNQTFVARKIDDEKGLLNLKKIVKRFSSKYLTIEILGGTNVFENTIDIIEKEK